MKKILGILGLIVLTGSFAHAIDIIQKTTSEDDQKILKNLFSSREKEFRDGIIALQKDEYKHLIKHLTKHYQKTRDWYEKDKFFRIFKRVNHPLITGLLIRELRSNKYSVIENAADLLGSKREPSAVQPMIKALRRVNSAGFVFTGHMYNRVSFLRSSHREKRKRIKRTIINGLGNIGDPGALKIMFKTGCTPEYHDYPGPIINALVNIGDPAVDFLIGKLDTSDTIACDFAVLALGKLRAERASEPLRILLKKVSNPRIREQLRMNEQCCLDKHIEEALRSINRHRQK